MIRFFFLLYNLFRRLTAPVYLLLVRFRGNRGHLERAIRKAKRRHRRNGRRYRVTFIGRRYRVYHRDDIRELKKNRAFNHAVNVTGMERQGIIYFDTNTL